jgi:hypothetical protein
MRAADVDLLMVPGWTGAGPEHWMRRWTQRLSTAQVVEQADWGRIVTHVWVERVAAAMGTATRPVVLVGHSCGVATIIHLLDRHPSLAAGIAGLVLVAPASDAATATLPNVDPTFIPVPRRALGVPALLIASRTDPFCPYEEAERLAAAWGAQLVDAGDSGHINTESGHGPWPDGVLRLAGFLRHLGSRS